MIFFVFGYILITTIILWYFIKTDGLLFGRLISLIIIYLYCISLIYIFPLYMGWPVESNQIPQGARIVSYCTYETKDNHKSICFWAINKNEKPRAYELSYSKALHKEISRAMSRAPKGSRVMVEGNSANNGRRGQGRNIIDKNGIHFKIVLPQLPAK